jgi:transcriptional regulator with PAS, ATPase and Fis domain
VDSGAIPGTLWEAEIFGAVKGAYTGADREHRGIAEIAAGGTIFFDEVGEIPLEFQPKLLRFLQEKEYRPVGASAMRKADVRVVAATNRNPEQMIAEGTFRPDLYYRLNVLRIDVPPLRERREDIEFLAKRFLVDALAQTSKHIDLDPGALEALRAHTWPGNVRELRNTIYRLVAMNPPGRMTAHDLRLALTAQATDAEENPSDELDAVERQQIRKILEQTGGNKTRAAEILGIQRRTLYKKLARMEKE